MLKQATFMETSGFDPREPGPLTRQMATHLASVLPRISQNMFMERPGFVDISRIIHFEIKVSRLDYRDLDLHTN